MMKIELEKEKKMETHLGLNDNANLKTKKCETLYLLKNNVCVFEDRKPFTPFHHVRKNTEH